MAAGGRGREGAQIREPRVGAAALSLKKKFFFLIPAAHSRRSPPPLPKRFAIARQCPRPRVGRGPRGRRSPPPVPRACAGWHFAPLSAAADITAATSPAR